MSKPIALTIQGVLLTVFLICKFALPNGGQNHIAIAYIIVAMLTLPSLISKVVLKNSFSGIYTVLSFLIFPVVYLVGLVASAVFSMKMAVAMQVLIGVLVILWNVLFSIQVLRSKDSELQRIGKSVSLLLLVAVIYGTIWIGIRNPDSVVALDYLQHQTVVNGMNEGTLCLLPINCSNLFLQQGYTTFYHTILGAVGSFSGNDLSRTFFLLDLIWPLMAAIVIMKLLSQLKLNWKWLGVGVLLSLFVFVNGAYEFIFFLPQTFAFYLFLNLLVEKRLNVVKFAVGLIVLLLSHFVMGGFLVAILVIKFIIVDLHLSKHSKGTHSLLLLLGLLPAQFMLILNIMGFSFERLFQNSELLIIGSPTNLYFPNNLQFVGGLLMASTALLIISIIYFWRNRDKNSVAWIGFYGLCINLAAYFLALTYANKFLIGFGLFSTILIVGYLSKVRINRSTKTLVAAALVVMYMTNFSAQYFNYLTFYRQLNGSHSAVVAQDKAIIEFLRTKPDKCLVISDPLTQLIVASYTGFPSARAQYIKLPSREAINEFNLRPTDESLQKMINIEEARGAKEICYLYTSRLEQSRRLGDIGWLSNIYVFILDNYLAMDNDNLEKYFDSKQNQPLFQNDNFVLYQVK